MNQNSMMNELKWLTLQSCVDKWSNEGYEITSSEALQFCREEKLKVSCQLFNKWARPVYRYSPLLDDGYYQRVARMILAKENKKSQKDGIIFSSIAEAGSQNPLPDLNSDGYTENFLKQHEEYDLRLNDKSKEIFSRWKKRGMSNVSFEYGDNRMLDGPHQLVIDKQLADCLTRMALDYDISTLDDLCVVNDDGERFQLINDKNKPVEFRLSLGDLIIQKHHRVEFENEYLQNNLTEESLQESKRVEEFFINTPKRKSGLYKAVEDEINEFKEDGDNEKRLPTCDKIWSMLIASYSDNYNRENRSIDGLKFSSKPEDDRLTFPDFRNLWEGWINK